VIAHTINLQHGVHMMFAAESRHIISHGRLDIAHIPRRLPINNNRFAGRCFPAVKPIAVIPPAMVIIPDSPSCENFRYVQTVTEGIRLKIQIQAVRADAQHFGQSTLCIKDMTGHALSAGHILVMLHPCGSRNFPAAFVNPFFDLLQHGGIVLLHNPINGSLGLRKFKPGIVLHQAEHGAQCIQHDGDRLLPPPHPVHIHMGMGDTQHAIFLCILRQRSQLFFRRPGRFFRYGAFPGNFTGQKIQAIRQVFIILMLQYFIQLNGIFQLGCDPLRPIMVCLFFHKPQFVHNITHRYVITLLCMGLFSLYYIILYEKKKSFLASGIERC